MVGRELVDERGIEPHVNLIDKSERTDGTFSRSDFTFDTERDLYVCPGGMELRENIAARSPRRARVSPKLTARSAIAPLNTTATPARSSPSAAQTFRHAKSLAPFMKPLVTKLAKLIPLPTPIFAT